MVRRMDLLIPIILIVLIVSEIISFIPNKDDKDEYTGEGYEKRIWRD